MSGSEHSHDLDCAHCNGPATHQHTITGTYLCCGHASIDIDADPIRDGHECVKFHTVDYQSDRGLECEHRDNPNPPTGDLVLCHEQGVWAITTSRFPGNPFDPSAPGAPTTTRYCAKHFSDRYIDLLEEGGKFEVRRRDW